MQIKLWNDFSKRYNSTKIPTTDGVSIDNVHLKELTSLETPTFILHKGYNLNFTYAYAFSAYYFISETISISNELIEIHCIKDVLATYKSNILSSKQFVNYSSSNYNLNMLDSRISNNTVVTQKENKVVFPYYDINGYYVLTAIGENGGLSQKYTMLGGVLNNLASKISQLADDTIIDKLVKQFGNVFGAITGLTYIPLSRSEDVPNTSIYLGSWDSGVVATALTQEGSEKTISVEIPWINKGARRLNESIELFLPYIGNVQLNTEFFTNKNSVNVEIAVDYITGELIYIVDERYKYSTNTGVPMQFSTYTQSANGTLLSYGGSILNTLFTKWGDLEYKATLAIGGTEANTLLYGGSMPSQIYNKGINYNVLGSIGGTAYGRTKANNIIIRNTSFGYTSGETALATTCGCPLMTVISLSKLTGFCQCANASVELNADVGDIIKVNNFLNSGFFIE